MLVVIDGAVPFSHLRMAFQVPVLLVAVVPLLAVLRLRRPPACVLGLLPYLLVLPPCCPGLLVMVVALLLVLPHCCVLGLVAVVPLLLALH